MENKSAADRSPVLISAGFVVIIVIALVGLGFFAFQQIPVDRANSDTASNTAALAAAAPADTTAVVTETTTAITATAPVSATVTAMTATAVTTAATTAATTVVTTTAAVSATGAVTASTSVSAVVAAPAAGPVDIAAVTAVVTKGTCGACHTIPGIDTAVGMIGPSLAAIGTEAATRIPGSTADAYIRESILNPNAFVAPKCPTGDCLAGVMLPNLAQMLTPAEIDTIVNYLLTLKGQ